jgi:hypothetical protein
MSLCLCKSLLKEGQGGEGHAFHPLHFFLSCPLHSTSGERLQQSDVQGVDFEPPALRLWSLDDYLNDEIDDANPALSESPFISEASSSASQSKTPTPFRPRPAEVEGPLVDAEPVKERKGDSTETDLADKTSCPCRAKGSLPARASEQQIIPDQDDWEQYKHVIEDLYMRQNPNLAQVQNVMESNYGIRAT